MSSTSFLVLGDLHYDPADASTFEQAVQQLNHYKYDAIFQLGDLGAYHYPGSKASFEDSHKLFQKLKLPVHTLMGNHDLEGDEFETDEDNQLHWMETFEQSSLWKTVELGPHLGIVLSATKFRSHPVCHHQVSLGQEQFEWLQATLSKNKDRMTFIFCHVPIISSGLITLLTPHQAGPNAVLDQSENPFKYDQLLEEHPQIRLWFSGHIHLGHQYLGGISQRHQCTFIHTGTMSHFSRDGLRQSRMIVVEEEQIKISTIDHLQGNDYLDATLDLDSLKLSHYQYLHKQCLGRHKFTPKFDINKPHWKINDSLMQWHHDHLVEYDRITRWPLGIVYRGPEAPTRCDKYAIYIYTQSGEERFTQTARQRFSRPHMPSREYLSSADQVAIN